MTAFVLALAATAQARVGLMTTFVDVVLNRVSAGRDYDVAKTSGDRFSLTNRGEKPVRVAVEVQAPAAEMLEAGYEAVPDPRWVEVTPAVFELAPGETKPGKVTLRIPKDPALKGRHFQVSVWSRLTGMPLAAGVRSRLFFSVDAEGPKLAPRPAAPAPAMRLEPAALTLQGAATGKRFPQALTLTNDSDQAVTVTLRSAPCRSGAHWPEGYAATPAPEFLLLPREAMTLQPGERRVLPLEFAFPAGRAHAGKRYGFAVRAELSDGALAAVSEVFAAVGGKR